jgi:cyclophilin family peptidyl-prolyl cis-trans isomerase
MRQSILIVFLILSSFCTTRAQEPDYLLLQVKAPETFRAKFKTTKGDFIIEANRVWSPEGVDRLYQLIKSNFFNNALFFRVEPTYVVQFGISASYKLNRFWDPKKLSDELIRVRNVKGMIAYAQGKPNDRSTQLFINMVDNPKLDTTKKSGTMGFTPIARVISGMENLTKLNSQYGKKPAFIQDSLYKYGNPYFDKRYPGLDKIISVSFIK